MLQSRPPAPDAGAMSIRTAALRPDVGLSVEVIETIRRLRRQGDEPEEIASTLSVPLSLVERSLLAMRTAKTDRTRRSLNCTLEAAAFVDRERQPGEAVHEVMDRLLGELQQFRAGAL